MGQGGRRQAQDSIFVALLFSTLSIIILELAVDLLSTRVFYGSRVLLTFFTFWFYVVNPLPGALYLLYLDQQRRRWVRIPRGIGIIAFTPFAIAFILTFTSLFNGIIYSIDSNNAYQRGPLIILVIIADFICMFFGFAYLIIHRESFKQKDFSLFVFFPIPVLIGAVLQANFYGMEVAGISLAVTLLIVYLQMQNSQANKDYLTSLYNRSLSEQYLNHLFGHRKKDTTIGGIMMDLNNFKMVNDTYGHDLGDTSLRFFSRLLSDSFGSNWFIARYGGDEFILLRENVSQQDMEADITHFHVLLAHFNTRETLPFELSISTGSTLFNPLKHSDGPSFIKDLDTLMYEDKRRYHASQKREGHSPK